MKVIVTVVDITSEAHLSIPDGLSESAIKQHITDLYNSGKMLIDLNIAQVDLVESIPGIIRGTSLLNLGVRLSPHPASDVLSLRFCSCVCNRDNSHELLLDYFSSNWHDFRRCGVGEPFPHR